MGTSDLAAQNVEKIGALFPNCITETIDQEGRPKKAINFGLLCQMLSGAVTEGDEAYEFTWVGKKASIVEANRPTQKTLRPCVEESKNWDTTENLYIEGDNLEVLKLLQESYLGKVKMIYIDPPYNTGNDFLVYSDNYTMNKEDYRDSIGLYNEEGMVRFKENNNNNPRFHSDWCSMIYPRLLLARNLLSEDGVIFISIDDKEEKNLRAICDEIFGSENAVSPFIWLLPRGINAGLIARSHEYILCYAKNIRRRSNFNRISGDTEYSIERCNKKIDSRHPKSSIEFPAGIRYEGPDKVIKGVIEGSERIYITGEMVFKEGRLDKPVTLCAGWTMKNMILDWLAGRKVYDLKGQEIEEFFFKENGKLYSKKVMSTLSVKSVLKDMPDTQMARKELERLFGSQDIFSYPKTVELPKLFAALATDDKDIILDFFSGSATTAEAVMRLNHDKKSKRKYILVQLPEQCAEGTEAFQFGYRTICEIGKERIRRAGEKIKAENPSADETPDIGFRVLKLADSNRKDVYYSPAEYDQGILDFLETNIKEDRTDLDLLFGCLLEWGIPLSLPYASEDMEGCTVHNYNNGDLIACFDESIPDSVIRNIAKKRPLRAVFRDSGFADSPSKINAGEVFSLLAPDTRVKVI